MSQLLFFDTFSHDLPEELNLDLVQFPRTVVVEEVRVIPLGARVDVGGMGSRLGATNPNRFSLDFFVNDLMNPSASVFANLGSLSYDHNSQIYLDTRGKRIPTDGLLLRGHYSAITLAIYGVFSTASAAQFAPAGPEYEQPAPIKTKPQAPQAPITQNSPEKRWSHSSQQPASKWPPPIQENALHGRQIEDHSQPSSKQSNWMLENGTRDNAHDYHPHHSNHHQNYHHHHHSSSSQHHYRRSQERARSPPTHREFRSRTKSPLVSHSSTSTSRRSLTPKSPPHAPNNGHLSPSPRHSRRSISSERQQPVPAEDVQQTLDDVSDISDGDIADEVNDADEAMEDVNTDELKKEIQPQEKHGDPILDSKLNDSKDAFISSDQKLSDDEMDRDGKQQMMDIPEDIEEISDDEADWSDDGDCFFADMVDYDSIDFGSDWVDPIKVFDLKDAALPEQLDFQRNFVIQAGDKSTDTIMPSEVLVKLRELNNQEVVGSDWVELVESVTDYDLPQDVALEPIVRRSISIADAMRQQAHTYKVRHLKSGLKFTEAALKVKSAWTLPDFQTIIPQLLELLEDSSFTAPLKIGTLIAMHSVLDHSIGRKVFLEDTSINGTSRLITVMGTHKLTTRLKIGIASLIERLTLNEAISSVENVGNSEDLLAAIGQITSFIKEDKSPKLTFLSNVKCGIVSHVFKDLQDLDFLSNFSIAFDKYCESCEVRTSTLNLFEELVQSRQGLILLTKRPVLLAKILATLRQHTTSDHNLNSVQFMLYSLHIICKLDLLFQKCSNETLSRRDLESMDVLEAIQDLYGMTYTTIGRSAVVHLLSISNFMKPIIRLVKHTSDEKDYFAIPEDDQPKKDMKRSAIRGYACELLLLVVRTSNEVEYLSHFSDELLSIGRSDETSKLHELTSWLSFFEDDKSINVWENHHSLAKVTFSSMEFFVETIKKHIENISPMSCELAMAVRHLYRLICQQDDKFGNYEVLIKAFSLNLCDHGITILNKACGYHEQPHLHTATFAGYNGHLLLATIHPIVKIMKKLLGHLIKTQDDGFRDVSAIQALLKTFTLCTVVSDQYGCHKFSVEICTDIVDILKSYTSISVDMSQDRTTPWQLMLQEVTKYVITSPHTYISGLKLLNELMPMPLDWSWNEIGFDCESDQLSAFVSDQEKQRNMWSAQLYGMENQLKEIIEMLLPCRTKQVKTMLATVCQQLADLSAPIAVIVADAILSSLRKNPEDTAWQVGHLVTFGSIKAAFLSLLKDKYKETLSSLPKEVISVFTPPLMDPDVSLPTLDNSKEVNPNGLPDLENAATLFDAFITTNVHKVSIISRTFVKLSETMCGLSLLRTVVMKRKTEVLKLLKSMTVEQLAPLEKSLLDLYKITSLEEWRELFEWTHENSSDSWLNEEPFSKVSIGEKLLESLSNDSHKAEEHDSQWPQSDSLLEQFCQRYKCRSFSRNIDTELLSSYAIKEDVGESSVDLMDLIQNYLTPDFDLEQQVKNVCDEKSLEKNKRTKKQPKSLLEARALVNKNLIINFKAGGNVIKGSRSVFNRGQRPDLFRSRPKNTSRPPSLHVDDYMALEARGQQPTGPTGYNKQSVKAAQELFAEKEAKSKGSIVGFREATDKPVYDKPKYFERPNTVTHQPSGNKNRGSDRNSGKSFRGNSRHSPSAMPRDYGGLRDGRSGGPGGRPQGDRRYNNPRRNNDSRRGKDRHHKGKGRGDGPRSNIAR